MTSRRRFRLPAIAPPLRGGLAVGAVGAFVGALLMTGQQGASIAVAASADHPATRVLSPATLPHTGPASVPDVSRALAMFGLAAQPRASRSHQRVAVPAHRWVRPNGGPLTSPFGMRWGRLHAGIDLAGPYGSTIVAATDGCISFAGPEQGYGQVMMISDWDGTETVYGHMSSFLVRSGCVRAGTAIARVGAEGDATGPHLHFEVRVGGTPIDPIPFLRKRGVWI